MSHTASSPLHPGAVDSGRQRAPFLDELRGLAILAVFLLHALAAVCPISVGLLRNVDTLFLAPLVFGKYGVAMFFAISGFCIHMSHRRARNLSWSRFAAQRFFCLYPAYVLALIAFFFCWPWKPFSLAQPADAYQFWMHLGLTHNLDDRTLFGINVSWWSIAVEVQLYAAYPLLCWLASIRGWHVACAVAIAVECVIQAAGLVSQSLAGDALPAFVMASPFAFWGSWAIGVVIAEHFIAGTRSPISRVRWDVAMAAALVLGVVKPLVG